MSDDTLTFEIRDGKLYFAAQPPERIRVTWGLLGHADPKHVKLDGKTVTFRATNGAAIYELESEEPFGFWAKRKSAMVQLS